MHRLSLFLDPLPTDRAVERLVTMLDTCTPIDAAWTWHLLGGGRALRPGLSATLLRSAARQASGLPDWLFDACHRSVGDLAETVALTLPEAPAPHAPCPTVSTWITQVLEPLKAITDDAQALVMAWRALAGPAREVAIRISFGRWPAVLPPETLQAALARHADLPLPVVAQRWGTWMARRNGPCEADWAALVAPLRPDESDAAAVLTDWPLLDLPESGRQAVLGSVEDWIALQDLAGLPVRLVRRVRQVRTPGEHPERGALTRLWTTGSRLLDSAFPDLIETASSWPAPLVLDGELLPREPGGTLQARLGKAAPSAAVCRRTPYTLRVFEVIEGDVDGAGLPGSAPWQRAEPVPLPDWERAEGLLLLRRDRAGPTGESRRWRLPAAPMTAQVLLLHAQAGAGRDGGLYTDCTLAVWSRPPRDAAEADAVIEAIAQQRAPDPSPDALVLLPLARCTQGLSADERTRIDRLVRSTTVARHGPVRSVRPGLVLRLAFDAIEANARRRSGVMVREARLQGLLDDVSPWQASSLVELLAQADQRRARFGCQ